MMMALALWTLALWLGASIPHCYGLDEYEAFRFIVGEEALQLRRGESMRHLTESQFDQAYANPAFARCWDTLDEVSNDDNEVSRLQYLEFLRTMSHGEINETQFSGLSLGYVTMFLSAACSPGRSCQGQAPSIHVDRASESVLPIISLCYTLMRNLDTVATFDFSVSVEFDPNAVDDINQCLESAAENVLAASFGYEPPHTRLLIESSKEEKIASPLLRLSKNKVDSRIGSDIDNLQRSLNVLVDCPYDFSAEKTSVIFGPCLRRNELFCGTMHLRIKVSAAQLLEPYQHDLEHDAFRALELSVDDDTFEDNFPINGCGN